MDEEQPRRKRLKKTAELEVGEKLSFKDLMRKHQEETLVPSSLSTQDSEAAEELRPQVFSTVQEDSVSVDKSKEEKIEMEEEEEDEEEVPAKRKKSARKVKPPPLPKFNRLLDLPSSIFSCEEPEIKETEFLRNAPLTLPQKPKSAFTIETLLSKLKRSDSAESPILFKSVLSQSDDLQIEASSNSSRLQQRRETSNPRSLLYDALKQKAIDRKTQHLSVEQLLQKSISELEVKKTNQDEEADSDYLPGKEDEEEEAKQLQWAIDLEEGVKPAESDTEEECDEEVQDGDEANPKPTKESDSSSESADADAEESEESEEEEDTVSEAPEPVDEPMEAICPISAGKDSEESLEPLPSLQPCLSTEPQTSATSVSSRSRRNRFVEEEAELGSDNELHDDFAKPALDSDSSADDAELPELIDNAEVDDGDIEGKYAEDQYVKDQGELHQVINGEFRKRRNMTNYLDGDYTSKKQKLMEESMKMQQELDLFGVGGGVTKEHLLETEEAMDEEDASRILSLQEHSLLKKIEKESERDLRMMDDESQRYVNEMEQVRYVVQTRTLLPACEKSNSIDRVCQVSTNGSTLNKPYAFKTNTISTPALKTTKSKPSSRSLLSLIK